MCTVATCTLPDSLVALIKILNLFSLVLDNSSTWLDNDDLNRQAIFVRIEAQIGTKQYSKHSKCGVKQRARVFKYGAIFETRFD
jgi:hypothetical protein